MKRRTILTSVTSAAALVLAGDRTFAVAGPDRQQRPIRLWFADLNPDRMWPVYRRYHLLIVGQRDDESGSALAARVEGYDQAGDGCLSITTSHSR